VRADPQICFLPILVLMNLTVIAPVHGETVSREPVSREPVSREPRDVSSELPDEAFLLFLAEAIEVDGEWVDPLAYLEEKRAPGNESPTGELAAGGKDDDR